jgi:two-component system sensor histidine kinase KdpD
METRQRVIVQDIQSHPAFQGFPPFVLGTGYVTMQATPLFDHAGRTIGVISTYSRKREVPSQGQLEVLDLYAGLAADTIERGRQMDELARIEAELRQSIRLKNDFLGMVSHELRTPMTVVRGIASVLRRNDRLTAAELRQVYSDLSTESERLHRLIENMLALARIEAGKRPPTEPLVLDKVIWTIASDLKESLPYADLRVIAIPREIIVLGVEHHLRQIVQNLVENAVKYGSRGTIIELSAEIRDAEVEITVADRGSGVRDYNALFEPFYREEQPEVPASGLGLGLTVCKTLVELQGGAIWAKPRLGGGSLFCFTLPRLSEEDQRREAPASDLNGRTEP